MNAREMLGRGWITVTCGRCGHQADVDLWTRTTVQGELPPGQFQCPGCRLAFRRKEVEPGRTVRAGAERMYIPGRVALVPCEGRL